MTSPFARVLARSGVSLESARAEAEESTDRVKETGELARIVALPRRAQGCTTSGARAEDLVAPLTAKYRTPQGAMTLRPIQALALGELYEQRALVGRLLVGEGKTLVSYLAPMVLGAKRPLLILPGSLVAKTRREFHVLREHWQGPHPEAYPVVSYQFLAHPAQGVSVDGRPDWLTRQKPDLIILDEAHRCKNTKAIVTKRLKKFLEREQIPVVILTGTLYRHSIRDMAHLLEWALRAGSPLPRKYTDLEYWSRAIDPNVQQRIRPGSLVQLATPEERPLILSGGDEGLEALRAAFRRRLAETPGFVSSQAQGIDCSLQIAPYSPEGECSVITNAFATLRGEWAAPGGETFADGLGVARCARQLALGLYYRWAPEPSKAWRETRKAWNAWSRETLKNNGRGFESEVQVLAALRAGLYDDGGLHAAWIRERDAERATSGHLAPPTEAVWISDEGLEAVARWLDSNKGGIVFCEHVHFALRFSQLTGVKYFGAGGLAADGSFIEAHRGACLASPQSSRLGRNLQQWDTALLMTAPDEQLLGRLHRSGQKSDEVRFDLYLSCRENLTGFLNARTLDVSSMGEQAKLFYADITVPETVEKRGARWQ